MFSQERPRSSAIDCPEPGRGWPGDRPLPLYLLGLALSAPGGPRRCPCSTNPPAEIRSAWRRFACWGSWPWRWAISSWRTSCSRPAGRQRNWPPSRKSSSNRSATMLRRHRRRTIPSPSCHSSTCRRARTRSTCPMASRRNCSTCSRRFRKLRVIARTSSFSFKGKEAGRRHHRRPTACRLRAGRLGAKVRQPDPNHRAADPRRRQFAPVVGDLRPHAGRCVRRAGRDFRSRRDATEDQTARRGTEGAQGRSPGVSPVPAGAATLSPEHGRGLRTVDHAVPEGAGDRPGLCTSLGGAGVRLHQPGRQRLASPGRGVAAGTTRRWTRPWRSTRILRRRWRSWPGYR